MPAQAAALDATAPVHVAPGPATPGRAAPGPGAPVRRRLEVLDGVRLLAAVYVVIFHFSAGDRSTWMTPTHRLFEPLFHVMAYGWLGVQLFFMISGFVICMSAWGKSVGQFAVSRFVRLFPGYWVGIALTTAVLMLDRSMARPLPWPQILDNLTMTETFARVPYVDPSYWTLTIELTFYAFFGLCMVWRGLTYRRVVIFCLVWSAISLVSVFGNSFWFNLMIQPLYAPFFVTGITLFLMHRFGPNRGLWAMLAFSYAFGMYQLRSRVAGQHPSGVHLHYWVAFTIATSFFVVLTLIALGRLDFIRGRWLVTAGALTYPLYLLHQQIGETAIRSLDRHVEPWLLLALVFAGIVGLSYLMNRYAERPLAGLAKRLLTRRGAPPRSDPAR